LLPTDHFTRSLKQNGQNGKRLTRQFQLSPRLPELARRKIHFESPKADSVRGMGIIVHSSRPHSGLCRHGNSLMPERKGSRRFRRQKQLAIDFILTF
jgi:hypothetical protein